MRPSAQGDMPPRGASAGGGTGASFPDKGALKPLTLERLQSNQSALVSPSSGHPSQRHAGIVNSDPGASPSGHVTVGEGSAGGGVGPLMHMQRTVGSASEPLPQGRVQEDAVTVSRDPVTVGGVPVTVGEDVSRTRPELERLQSCNKSGVASLSDPLPLPSPSPHPSPHSQTTPQPPPAQADAPGPPPRHTEHGGAQGPVHHQNSWPGAPLAPQAQPTQQGLAAVLNSLAQGRGGGETGEGEQRPGVPAGMHGGDAWGRQHATEPEAAAEDAAGAAEALVAAHPWIARDSGIPGDLGNGGVPGSLERMIAGGLLTNPALRQYVANWLAAWTGGQAQQSLPGVDLAGPCYPLDRSALPPAAGADPTGNAVQEGFGEEGLRRGDVGAGAEQQRGLQAAAPPQQLAQPPLRAFQSQVPQSHARPVPQAQVEDAESCANYSWTSSLSAFLDQELLKDDAEGTPSGEEGPGPGGKVARAHLPAEAPRGPAGAVRGGPQGGGGGGAPLPRSTAAATVAAAAAAPAGQAEVVPEAALLAEYLHQRQARWQQRHHQQPLQHHQQQFVLRDAPERRLLPNPHAAVPLSCPGPGAPTAYPVPAVPAAENRQEAGPAAGYRDTGGPLLRVRGTRPAYPGAGAHPAYREGDVPVVHGMRQRRPVEILEAGEEQEVESAPRRRKRNARGTPEGHAAALGTEDRARAMHASNVNSGGVRNDTDNAVAVLRQFYYVPPQGVPCGVPRFADAAESIFERANPLGDRELRRRRLASSAFAHEQHGGTPLARRSGARGFADGEGADTGIGGVGRWVQVPAGSLAVEQRRWDFHTMLEQCNASDNDAFLLQKTMELGETLANSDLEAFRTAFPILSQYANPHGRAMSRLLHFVLHGFLLRITGMGYTAFNCPSPKPSQEMDTARVWYFKNSPTVEQFHAVALSTICSALAGKRRLHIIEFGYFMSPKWPVLFRILSHIPQQPGDGSAGAYSQHQHAQQHHQQEQAQGQGQGRSQGAGPGGTRGGLLPHEQAIHDRHIGLLALLRRHATASPGAGAAGPDSHPSPGHAKARLDPPSQAVHLRLTLVGLQGLTSPKRSDPQQRQVQQQELATWLKVAAAAAGIELELELLDIDKESLPQLPGKVVRRPWESLVVVAALEFDNLLDSRVLPIGQRETILEWIGSLKPRVFIMVGIDLDINDLPFLVRLYSVLVHQLPLFLSNEALAQHKNGIQHLHLFEDLFISRGTTNTIACEGEERVMRSQAMHRWKACMDAVGLVPGPMHGVDVAHMLLKGYPEGYGLQVGHGSMRLSFRGSSEMALSSWVPK